MLTQPGGYTSHSGSVLSLLEGPLKHCPLPVQEHVPATTPLHVLYPPPLTHKNVHMLLQLRVQAAAGPHGQRLQGCQGGPCCRGTPAQRLVC